LVDQAEIHRKSLSSAAEERRVAVNQIGINFAELPDKEQAWADLLRRSLDEDCSVRSDATELLGSAFPHAPDKEQAWADLLWLIQDEFIITMNTLKPNNLLAVILQLGVGNALGTAFSHVSDKEQAWVDLHLLTQDQNSFARQAAAYSLSNAFLHLPDKEQAWADLILLTQDKDSYVRQAAAESLSSAFPHVPDKEQAWADLHRLTQDKDSDVRHGAAGSLCSAFPHVPDKEQAWIDLHRITQDEDRFVRGGAAMSLGSAFPHVPDKEQAWADLHRLTQDGDSDVRRGAAMSLGLAFPYVPDKEQAWAELHRLSQDKNSDIWVSANHSLGMASIFRATKTETEEEFRKELEAALVFFERASKDAFINPAKFCLPFYRSFYTLTFKKQEAEAEVQRYLAEAKSATEGSENKEQLLEAIENLANALKEVQAIRETDFGIMKRDLNAYRRYCNRAAELLENTEEKAPGATKLIRRGRLIIGQRIEELLNEIDKETKILCDAARGTEAENFVNPTCKGVREIIKIRNPIELDKRINGLIPNLRFMVENLPERERDFGYDKIEILDKEEYLEDKLSLINEIIVFAIPHISMSKDLERLENKLDDITISLEPGIREELTVTVGAKAFGTGIEHKITIPLQEIKYSDLEKDLESIKRKSIMKLATLPPKLAEKVKGYLIRDKKDDILKHLS
jgi:HEAT repeat protein